MKPLTRSREGRTFLGSREFGEILADLAPLKCLDIGARGGLTVDLDPLAWAVEMYGFEPDPEEYERLSKYYSTRPAPFNAVKIFPVALTEHGGIRSLNIAHRRGSTSFLPGLPAAGARYSRADHFTIERTVDVETASLGEYAVKNDFDDAIYMKIDVEGLELEILRSAGNLLSSSILAVRAEVFFINTRVGQPLYCDIESYMRSYGFVPMGFLLLRHWRGVTKVRHPRLISGPIPYSRGQIAHGDMLFLRDPDQFKDGTNDIDLLLKEAFIAMAYEYVDHAFAILNRSSVKDYLYDRYHFSIEEVLKKVSLNLASRYRRTRWRRFLGQVKSSVARHLVPTRG